LKKGVKVAVLDWKGEYVGFVKGATVVRKVNPWDVGGRSAKEKAAIAVELLREITRDIADVSSASAALLLRELIKLYERGVPKTSDVVDGLETFFRSAMAERRMAEANMAAALLRRLLWLQIDEERPARNVVGSGEAVVYDLSELGSVYLKTIYSLTVLSRIYYGCVAGGQSDRLRMLVVAEECQNYIRGRRFDEPPSIGERMANELRAYGVGMVLISPDPVQIPWHLARDVAAVISIGVQAIPDSIREVFRTYDVRSLKRVLSGRKAYIFYNGRMRVTGYPKPPRRPVDLKTATYEVVEKAEERPEEKTVEMPKAEEKAEPVKAAVEPRPEAPIGL
jgi:hypothetical protein